MLYRQHMICSGHNEIDGQIAEVQIGSAVAHVAIAIEGGRQIQSIISRRTAEKMNLQPGDQVTAVVKSTDVRVVKKPLDAISK